MGPGNQNRYGKEVREGKQHRQLKSIGVISPILSYTLLGGLFGFAFPILSLVINAIDMGLPFNGATIARVHSLGISQWIIDTAPLVLAAFAYLAGRRQQQVLELNRSQARFITDRDHLIEQLQQTTHQLEQEIKRSLIQLSTTAQIARQSTNISAETPASVVRILLTQILSQSAALISAQFDFYHVGIFITDPAYLPAEKALAGIQDYAILIASNSPGGQHMLKRGHRLKVGGPGTGTGIVGYVAAEGKAKIALDVGSEAVYFDNPDLPETRSELALPLLVAGKTIGVLDVQSTIPAAFGEREVSFMSLIADSLASTIENAHLIYQLRSSLEEVRALHQQYLLSAWNEALTLQPTLEYSTSQGFINPSLRDNEQREQEEELPVANQLFSRQLSIPLALRDQVIGEINLIGATTDQNKTDEWLPEEVSLVQTIADQAAQALENARLIEETQRRAKQERITASIASKVWSYSDIDTILAATLQELGESLEATTGSIQLKVDPQSSMDKHGSGE